MMVDVQLRYGQENLSVKIPKQNLAQVVQPRKQQASKDITGVVRQALDTSYGLSLHEIITNQRVCVLIEDGTRAEPHEILIEELSRQLNPAKQLTFMLTTGSHEPNSARNQEIIQAIHESCQRHNLQPYKVAVHDGLQSPCQLIGTTSRGTPINANKIMLEQDAFVIAADMKNHYFAGYSNVVKNFLPGICNFTSIEANHSLALDPESTFGRHPFHPDPKRRTNPVAEDMLEAMQLILNNRPAFLLATITSGSQILWAASGDLNKVTAEGIQKIDETASFSVSPQNHIIVSPGGNPQDESLYNAQRGLELTKNAVRDQGEVLLLAECPKGVAPTPEAREFFYNYLTKPIPEILTSIKKQYKLYSHKAFKFAELIQRLSKIWIYTTLEQHRVEAAHLNFAPNPQIIVNKWISDDPDTQILVFRDANKIAVYSVEET